MSQNSLCFLLKCSIIYNTAYYRTPSWFSWEFIFSKTFFLHFDFRLLQQFKKLLSETPQVTPGATLEETYLSFVGKDCYIGLSQSERDDVFEDYQDELRSQAKHEFHELLWERTDTFLQQRMQPNSSQRLTTDDLNSIKAEIDQDRR